MNDIYNLLLKLPIDRNSVSLIYDNLFCKHNCDCKANSDQKLCCRCLGYKPDIRPRKYRVFCLDCFDYVIGWGNPCNIVCCINQEHRVLDERVCLSEIFK